MNRIRKMSCILAVVASVVLMLLLSLDRAAAGVSLSNLGVEVSNQPASGVPLGTTITYQGSLTDNGAPANGAYDFEFRLYDAASGGGLVEAAVRVNDLLVTNGLFTAALDFGDTFDGTAVWLEIGVRAGNSTAAYTTLSPRQLFYAVPYALGLRPGAVISNSLTGPALTLASSGDGLTVDHAGGDGLYVCSTGSETSCSPTGFNNGLEVGRAEHNGVSVQAAGNNGMFVNLAGLDGLSVNHAGGEGIFVCSTGNQTDCTPSGYSNGLEVGRADVFGVRVGWAGDSGVSVNSAGVHGLEVGTAGIDGLRVNSAGNNGVDVVSAGGSGVYVGSAINNGLNVDHANEDGLFVCSTGSETSCSPTGNNNGLEVGRAENHGVSVDWAGEYGFYVDYAGYDGVYVNSADIDGVQVNSAAIDGVSVVTAGDNGLNVGSVGGDGVYVDSAGFFGVQVNSAAIDGVGISLAGSDGVAVGFVGNDGIYVISAGHYGVDVTGSYLAGYFNGDIQVTGSCTGCLLATFAVNSSGDTLQPGDLVTIQGTRPSEVDSAPILMEVAKANVGQAVIGVVGGWAELVTEEEPRLNEIGLRLIPREGPAKSGAFVTVIYNGPVQIKASGLEGSIVAGTRLTLGADGGVCALQTTEVNGLQIAESAPVVGIALSAPDADGLVWVLVNPQ